MPSVLHWCMYPAHKAFDPPNLPLPYISGYATCVNSTSTSVHYMCFCSTVLQLVAYKVLAMVPSSAGLRLPVLLATAKTTK